MTVFNFKLDKSLVRLVSVEIAKATMRDILLIGAGKIGETIVDMLCASGDYRVTAADRSDLQLQKLPRRANLKTLALGVRDGGAAHGRSLSGPHRGCGEHPPGQDAGAGRGQRAYSPMRSGARLYLHRGAGSGATFRSP